MRNLKIATPSTASKVTLLELEIQIEKAVARRLSAGQEAALWLRIRQGDTTAIPPLVDGWQMYVFSIIRQHLNAGTRVAPLVAAARQALTHLAESELNATGREHFFRFGPFAIRRAILQELNRIQPLPARLLPEPEGEIHEVLATQTTVLNKLNDVLLQLEESLAGVVAERLQYLHRQQVTNTTHSASEVDTEALVQWYVANEKAPVHECWLSFRYRDVCMENNIHPLLSGITTTYRQSHFPHLLLPYCFLLYHLLEKARPRLYTLLPSIVMIRVQVEGGNEWTGSIE